MNRVAVCLVFVFALLNPVRGEACACCADDWDHSEITVKREAHVMAELKSISLSGRVVQQRGSEQGVNFGSYASTARFTEDALIISLRSDQGQAATLRFPLPEHFTDFQAHMLWVLPKAIYEQQRNMLMNAPMYKELRMKGKIAIDPAIASTARIATESDAVLTLSGQGNRCFAGGQYRQWLLQFDVRRGQDSESIVGRGQVLATHHR